MVKETAFTQYCMFLMESLINDFVLEDYQAAAIAGNLCHESGLVPGRQETHPIAGRGGLGWGQWTGARRVNFERYCRVTGYLTSDYRANYGFLCVELKGPYALSLIALHKCKTVQAATKSFEETYERAGVVSMTDRLKFANMALSLYRKGHTKMVTPVTPIAPATVPSKPWYQSTTIISGAITAIASIGGIFLPVLHLVPVDQTTQLVVSVITAITGVTAIAGRVNASTPIGSNASAATTQSSLTSEIASLNEVISELSSVLTTMHITGPTAVLDEVKSSMTELQKLMSAVGPLENLSNPANILADIKGMISSIKADINPDAKGKS